MATTLTNLPAIKKRTDNKLAEYGFFLHLGDHPITTHTKPIRLSERQFQQFLDFLTAPHNASHDNFHFRRIVKQLISIDNTNYSKAFSLNHLTLLRREARRLDIEIQNINTASHEVLGELLYQYAFQEQDPVQKMHYLADAASFNHPLARHQLAEKYYHCAEYSAQQQMPHEQTIAWLQQAINLGHKTARMSLLQIYIFLQENEAAIELAKAVAKTQGIAGFLLLTQVYEQLAQRAAMPKDRKNYYKEMLSNAYDVLNQVQQQGSDVSVDNNKDAMIVELNLLEKRLLQRCVLTQQEIERLQHESQKKPVEQLGQPQNQFTPTPTPR